MRVDVQNMVSNFVTVNTVVPDNVRNGTDKNTLPSNYVKIKARRDILTEAGLLKAGSIGYVTKEWVLRVAQGRCGCSGSVNWFHYTT